VAPTFRHGFRAFVAGARRTWTAGQSLAEFALVLPVLLVVVLFALDLGRLFYSYVTIHNAARVAANYAGAHPFEAFASGSDYALRVGDEGLTNLDSFCSLPSPAVPKPTFTDSIVDANATPKDLGDRATVTISCNFRLLTPVIGSIVGDDLDLHATAVFTIRHGTPAP